eukprot:2213304-Prymnesium_polylepis.1
MFAKVLAGSTPTNAERVGFAERAVLVHAVYKDFGWRVRGALPWRAAHVAARIVPSTHLESGARQLGRSVASEH